MDEAGIIARDFKVDRRTVSRWIKAGRLPCPEGFADVDYLARSLKDKERSCSLGEANRRLKISSNTGLLWRRKKLLKTVKVFNVTRERIRQIEAKALEKIRQHHKAEKLKGY